ncbi:AhpC-TSA-domain-containing protein [Microstroma glucosiphilum]|uniref:AhpC-TSA-domain-containing protein n=1 Tax=Pseudomicrostroma glucosiphilum TaxID=1684307 RepID=A0A316UC73_9BASI|nr:AhpC-TSA-domain-containing protein [Pseudomicrostroma glucosiphilum]PWN22752.1 AhpC-TSA-domain-containing protein [Pseudomicrostroma glucosiphilum]
MERYPKANTGGCTNQAQAYRDEYASWQELGYSVYGLSSDNVTPLKNWKEKYSFEYKLLSDPPRNLIGLLTGTKSKTIRSHVVIDSNGKLADIKLNVPAKESSKQALAAAQKAA